MTAALPAPVADALVVLGLLVISLGVFGMYRMSGLHMQLQATAKPSALGIVALLLAAAATLDAEIAGRAALIAAFVLLTAPVAAHAIARGANRGDDPPG